METIIVEICIASTGMVADFMLPAHVQLSKLIGELARLIEQHFQETSFAKEAPMLCDMATRQFLPENQTLAQAGIRDGHRLMIV